MKSFASFTKEISSIDEAVSSKNFTTVTGLIVKYLRKSLGAVYYFPTPEEVTSSKGGKFTGIRFFFKNKSFRLNWKKNKIDSYGLTSIDYWDGSVIPQPNPSHRIQFRHDESLVKVLPFLVEFLQGKTKPKDNIYVDEHESDKKLLAEASYSAADIAQTVENMKDALRQGKSLKKQYEEGGHHKYGPKWGQAQEFAKKMYPSLFKRDSSRTIVIDPDDVDKLDTKKIVAAILGDTEAVSFDIVRGAKEVVEVEGISKEQIERLSYEEQLESLKTGMKLLMSNATNALFLGGRGGTGKTQTVEDMLHAAGRRDGDGYVKITGSATPAGIYRILFQNRTEILLFDDSDSALADQEGRNLFKAASDTKKKRKIAWQKGGKNYVDPEDYDEDGDPGILPRSFEFTGKIIFISNLPLEKLDPDGALRTRGYVISIDPTNEEIYDFMLKICGKIPLDVDHELTLAERREVVAELKSRKIKDKTANLRTLVRALNTRAGVESQGGSASEWKKFVRMFA